jgi:hypothetical protein
MTDYEYGTFDNQRRITYMYVKTGDNNLRITYPHNNPYKLEVYSIVSAGHLY